jgi:microcystin-dependent protein
MTDQYIGEIRSFGFNFAPINWATCDGQILSISQNAALFSLLGTSFGGNGTSNFGLPDLRGNVPMHWGNGVGLSPYVIGENAGFETVTITTQTMASHNHSVNVQEGGTQASVPNPSAWLGLAQPGQIYITSGSVGSQLAASAIGFGPPGGGQPHINQQPYLVINFCIALSGIFPSRG